MVKVNSPGTRRILSKHEASCYWQNYPTTAREYMVYHKDLSDQHAQESFNIWPDRDVDCTLPTDTAAINAFSDSQNHNLMLKQNAEDEAEQKRKEAEAERIRKAKAEAKIELLRQQEEARKAAHQKELDEKQKAFDMQFELLQREHDAVKKLQEQIKQSKYKVQEANMKALQA